MFCTDYIFFFFSSRRRHTRLQGDWSSDVCFPISVCDLRPGVLAVGQAAPEGPRMTWSPAQQAMLEAMGYTLYRQAGAARSEERRVGNDSARRAAAAR